MARGDVAARHLARVALGALVDPPSASRRLFVGFVGATTDFVDPSGVIDIGQPLVLGLLSVLLGTLLRFVWFGSSSSPRASREYYAAVAVLPKPPRFRFPTAPRLEIASPHGLGPVES